MLEEVLMTLAKGKILVDLDIKTNRVTLHYAVVVVQKTRDREYRFFFRPGHLCQNAEKRKTRC